MTGVRLKASEKRYLMALGLLSGMTLSFLAGRILATHTVHFYFVAENLVLAWLPLLFAWWLGRSLKKRPWGSWRNISLTILWLLFLPNSWYVLTDFIHLLPTDEIDILFDIVMIGSLVFTGFILGFTSLHLVHQQLLKRLKPLKAHTWIALALLLSSFAIYLGRDLRWSSADVVTNPSGIVLNITDRLINPTNFTHTGKVTVLFFFLLAGLYSAIWVGLRPQPPRN